MNALLKNGRLRQGTVLFLDEPETALHPEAQRQFVHFLWNLSHEYKVQLFLATHSSFVLNEFINLSEANKGQKPLAISLTRDETDRDIKAQIQQVDSNLYSHNAIMDTTVKQYEAYVDTRMKN